MAALMFLAGRGIKARSHAHAESTHFPTQCIIKTWKALSLWLHASQALKMHHVGKCVIPTWAWVLAITPFHLLTNVKWVNVAYYQCRIEWNINLLSCISIIDNEELIKVKKIIQCQICRSIYEIVMSLKYFRYLCQIKTFVFPIGSAAKRAMKYCTWQTFDNSISDCFQNLVDCLSLIVRAYCIVNFSCT